MRARLLTQRAANSSRGSWLLFAPAFTSRTSASRLSSPIILEYHNHSRSLYSASNPHKSWKRSSSTLLAAVFSVALVLGTTTRYVHADAIPEPPPMVVETSKMKKGASKEQNRALISSQHLQVKRSWENPGVYVWGSNSGKVAAPESQEAFTKSAKRIPFFDDLLLRDLKLDRDFGAAILENGDLVQWGKAYSEDTNNPEPTLKGQDLKSLAVSRDRVIALSRSGTVYSIPVSKSDQQEGPKLTESSWLPFTGGPAKISYRKLTPIK